MHAALPVAILYFPATHWTHGPSPSGPVHPALHVQSIRLLLAAAAPEFAGHAKHTLDEVPPGVVEYVFCKQFVHTKLALAGVYVPATHCGHVPPLVPEKPALQEQSVSSLLASAASEFAGHAKHTLDAVPPAVVEYVFCKQFVQTTFPFSAVYVPAIHCVHVPPLVPENPALQEQSVSSLLAAAASEFAGHAKHTLDAVPPGVMEYVFCRQSMHAKRPLSTAYLPAIHSSHVPPSGPADPALQVQSTSSSLASVVSELDGQLIHT